MNLHAEMAYCVVLPPSQYSLDEFVLMPEGVTKCSDILGPALIPSFTRSNTKLLDTPALKIRDFTRM